MPLAVLDAALSVFGVPLGAGAGLLSAAAVLLGLLAGACGTGAGSGAASTGFSGAFSCAGGGGKMVASMDSGGATSGVLIGRLGADQSRARMVP